MQKFSVEQKISYSEGPKFFKNYLKSLNNITVIYFINLIAVSGAIFANIIISMDFAEVMTDLGFAINHIISCREYMFAALLPIIITFVICVYIYITVEYSKGWIR